MKDVESRKYETTGGCEAHVLLVECHGTGCGYVRIFGEEKRAVKWDIGCNNEKHSWFL